MAFTWDAPACTNVIACYNLYSGPATRAYTNVISAGLCLTSTIPLTPGVNYIAATAVDTDGLESDYSNEVCYTNPGPALTNLQLIVTTTGTAILFARTLSGPWTRTNTAALTLINPLATLYFRSIGPIANRVGISSAPF